jgi:hypothetical protein
MPDVLLDIPSWLSAVIVGGWLRPKDITALDSAYCAKRTRTLFLNAIKAAKPISVGDWLKVAKQRKFASWVVKRKVPVCSLAIAGSLPVFDSFPFVKSISTTLSSIKLKSSSTMVALIGCTCSRVRDAELYDCSELQALGAFLQGVHSTVERLVLTNCIGQDCTATNRKPAMHSMLFPNLRVLIVNSSFREEWCNAIIERCPVLHEMRVRMHAKVFKPMLPKTLKRIALELDSFVRYIDVLNAAPHPSLEVLSLTGYVSDKSASFVTLLPTWPQLYAVRLQHSNFSDHYLVAMAQALPNLRYFNADSSHGFTAAGLAGFITACEHLIDLSLKCALKFRLDDPLLVAALGAAARLQYLDVGDNTLGPQIVSAIAQLPNLKELGAYHACFTSRDFGLEYIAEHAACLGVVRVLEITELPLRILWGKAYPKVGLVTNRASSDFWRGLEFPTAPNVDLSYTGE